jgi:hypothetical protein
MATTDIYKIETYISPEEGKIVREYSPKNFIGATIYEAVFNLDLPARSIEKSIPIPNCITLEDAFLKHGEVVEVFMTNVRKKFEALAREAAQKEEAAPDNIIKGPWGENPPPPAPETQPV